MEFRDPSFYDAPGMLLQQAASGNLDVKNTLLNPEALSPSQRRSMYEASTGGGFGNRLVDTIGEIATNPFTYLALLTGPVGQKALKSGRALLSVAKDKDPLIKESLSLLESLGLTAPIDMLGSQAEKVAASVSKIQEEVRSTVAFMRVESTKDLLDGLSEKFGRRITSLNPDDFADPAERQFMQRLRTSLAAKAHGLDKVQNLSHQEYLPEEFAILNKKGERVDTKRLLGESTDTSKTRIMQAEDLATKLKRDRSDAWEALKAERTKQQRIRIEAEANAKTAFEATRMTKKTRKTYEKRLEKARKDYSDWMDSTFRSRVTEINNMGFDVQVIGKVKRTGDVTRASLVDGVELDNFLSGVRGTDKYLEGFRDQRNFELIKLLGKESDMLEDVNGLLVPRRDFNADNFVFDDDKVRNYLDYQRNVDIRTKGSADTGSIVGEDLVNLMANDKARVTPTSVHVPNQDVEAFKKLYRNEMKDAISNGQYAPRNVTDVEDIFSGVMSRDSDSLLATPEGRLQELFSSRAAINSAKKSQTVASKEKTAPGIETDSVENVIRNGRLMPRSNLVPEYSTKDLEILADAGLLTDEGVQHALSVRRRAQQKLFSASNKNIDPNVRTIALDLERSGMRATKESAAVSSYVTNKSNIRVRNDEMSSRFDTTRAPGRRDEFVQKVDREGNLVVDDEGKPVLVPKEREPGLLIEEKDSNWRATTVLRNGASKVRQGIIDDLFVPVITGMHDENTAALISSTYHQKRVMKWVADSWIGKTMETYGGKGGKEFVKKLRWFGGDESMPTFGSTMSERMSSFLYVSHMGFNLSSVAVNLLQPLTNAATVANPLQIVKSYGRAFKSVFGYAADRVKMGARLATHAERNELVRKHFAWADDLGLTADFMKMIEADHMGREGGFWSKFSRLSMSMFEKSEWMNRAVTANLLEDAYKAAGRTPGFGNWSSDLRGFIARTQFASNNPLYRPSIYNRQKTSAVHTAGLLSNSLFRMFMQFPHRTATTFFSAAPTWGGEESYLKGLTRHAMKALGYSAIVHETASGLLGADLTRGLAATGVTDVIGGRKMLYEDQWYPVPPIARLPVSMLRGIMGDSAELAQSLSALIPGGMALSKALSIAPQLPSMGGGLLQRTFADYSNIQQDGTVPIYKQDGTLVGYQKPSEIVLKGLGVDLGSGQLQGKIDGYLIKQRQEIIKYRHEYLRKLAGNDISGAEAVRSEFSTKYKNPETGAPLPLTVTQAQVKQYLRSRDNIARTERILDSLTPDVRMQMANAIGSSVNAGADLSSGMTAAQRERYNPTSRDQMLQDIWSRVESVGAAASSSVSPVGPAATFTDPNQGP